MSARVAGNRKGPAGVAGNMKQQIAVLAAVGMLAVVPGLWGQAPAGQSQGMQQGMAMQGGMGRHASGCGGQAWARPGERGMGMMRGGMMRMGMMHGRMMRGFGRHGMWRQGWAWRWPMLRQRLGLTPAQAAQLSGAWMDWQKTRIMDRANQQIGRLELARLMTAAKPDEAAVDQQLRRLEQLRLGAAEAAVHFRLAVRQALTPAQRQKLHAMRWEGMRGGMGRGWARHGEDH